MQTVTRRTLILSAGALTTLQLFGALNSVGQSPHLNEVDSWNLKEIYATDAQWELARQAVMEQLPSLASYRGSLGSSPNALFTVFVAISDLRRTILRIDTYATLLSDEDMRVAANQQKLQLARDLQSGLDEASAWVLPEIIAVGPIRISQFLASDPRLKRFSFDLDDMLRHKAHTLPAEEEALVAAAGEPLSAPAQIQREILTSRTAAPNVTLSDGRSIAMDDGSLATVATRGVRKDRKALADAYWQNFSKLKGVLGATLNASVRGDIYNARAHRFKSSLEASLFELNIPIGAYERMISVVNAGLPVLHRYYELRRKILGLSELQHYDLSVPLATIDRKFSLSEIRDLTLQAVKPLGPAYQSQLATATHARWMDPYPRPGKRPGGYCNPGAYEVHPYVLLNVTPSYAGATEFAHEWGHAMHAVLATSAQPFNTFNAPPFVQEVASTCNEQLLVRYMMSVATTRQEKLFYLGQQMDNFASVFFRQAMKAEFEAAVHLSMEKGQDLSGEQMTDMYLALLRRYYGPSVQVNAEYATEWGRQPQYYNAFYIFQYVIAITGAVYFSKSILDGGALERDRYLAMLSQGGSNFGYEVLRTAGMDLANDMPYENVIRDFEQTLNQAEVLFGQIPSAS